MEKKIREIKFEGAGYILVLVEEKCGAITTKDAYERGLPSYAYLYPNGNIMRLGERIGTIEDVTFGDMLETKPTLSINMVKG